MNIAKSSPLYTYWNSPQGENDDIERLSKINSMEPASNLFRNEPYKWENLYQSLLTNIIGGDESSLKGLMVLLSTLNKNEKDKCINSLEFFLDEHVIDILRNQKYKDLKSSRNIFSALKILFNIFFNPFGLVIKKSNNHIYENTGMFFYHLRKVVFFL